MKLLANRLTAVDAGPSSPSGWRSGWLLALALALGTWACYWPVWRFEYVNLDDTLYVSQNQAVLHGLTWKGFKWAFQTMAGGNWHPLVWLSHMLDCQIWGLTAGGHHVTNVLLHTASVLLLFALLRQMTGTLWRSAFAAALFAWHPSHVESVAWISERKDVLSTLFWLLTMGAYLRYARGFKVPGSKSKVYYALALVFFVCGLMSKAMLVTLPLVLLLMDWWPLQRIAACGVPGAELKEADSNAGKMSLFRALVEKIPFLMLSLAGCVVAIWAQEKSEAVWAKPFYVRLENAAVSCLTYVFKFAWPVKLAVFYPYPETIAVWRPIGAAIILIALTLLVIRARKQRPYLAVGWLWFLVTLLPVIGLFQVGMQAMADRYTYVPYMGLGLMASWGLTDWVGMQATRRLMAIGFAVVALAACATLTHMQAGYWRDSMTLYQHALKVVPDCAMAHDNLGIFYMNQKNYEAAAEHLREAIRLDPKYAMPYSDLGKTYLWLGKMGEAMLAFSNAARLNPGLAQARWNLGSSYLSKGDVTNGLAEMKAAVDLSPDDVEAHIRFGNELVKAGRTAEAAPYFEMVVRTLPGDAHAHFMLGTAYLAQQRPEKAVAQFGEAAQLAPDTPPCLNALAWIYATSPRPELRNGPEAVRLAERACGLSKPQNAETLDTLAAAYAEAGRFAEAIRTAQEARTLAQAAKNTALADAVTKRIELYRAQHPYRD